MKKLLVLTTLGILVASTTGCQWCNRLFRGSRTQTTPVMGTVMMDPCVTPCDPCGVQACGPVAGAVVTPAPGYGGN